MAVEIILIKHPDVDVEPRRTTRKAFNTVWADKGWYEVDQNGDPIKKGGK